MEKRHRALFLCGTPFHVISSIILKYQLDLDADIVINDAFSNIDQLKKNLENEKIFKNIRIIDRKRDFNFPLGGNAINRYLYALTGYFRIKNLVTRVFSNLDEYSDVFFANDQNVDIVERYVYCYLKNYLPRVKLHYMEDGLGSYHEDYYKLTKLDYLLRKVVVRGQSYVVDMNIFLYSPKLYRMINPSGAKKIECIEKPVGEVIETIKKVFSYIIIEDVSSYEMIIFDTVREETFSSQGNTKFDFLVKKIVSNKKTIVKSHPREKKKYFDYKYFQTEGFPFEVLCLYNDFSACTFVNNYSNAVFTPKILFDQEPHIVFTYKALKEWMKDKGNSEDLMISKFIELYKDKSKIEVIDYYERKK